MKKKALVIYFNDNKPSNFQEKIIFSDKNLMQKFQKRRIILVAMCDDCLNKKDVLYAKVFLKIYPKYIQFFFILHVLMMLINVASVIKKLIIIN